jgi:hypothetical protein
MVLASEADRRFRVGVVVHNAQVRGVAITESKISPVSATRSKRDKNVHFSEGGLVIFLVLREGPMVR